MDNVEKEEEEADSSEISSNSSPVVPGSAGAETPTDKKQTKKPLDNVDSRIAPVKKGQFFEHDNRDAEEEAATEAPTDTAKQTKEPGVSSSSKPKRTKKPKAEVPKTAAQSGAEATKDAAAKWTHDLFEKQLESERNKETRKAKSAARPKAELPKKQAQLAGAGEKTNSKGKGLSLSEYLEGSPVANSDAVRDG